MTFSARGTRLGVSFAMVLVLAGISVVTLAAQPRSEPESERFGWRVIPYAGSYAIDQTDGVYFPQGAGAGLQLGTLIGVALDFDSPVPGLGFRVGHDRTIGARAFEGVGTADASVRTLWLDARLQPVPGSWAVRPFVFIGAESFEIDFEEARGFPFELDSKDEVSSRYGLGTDVHLFGWVFRFEGILRRYHPADVDDSQISQQNFAVVGGVQIPIR